MAGAGPGPDAPPDITVVMPCLNEEASVGACVADALEGIRRTGLSGEVVVCDNGSTDASGVLAAAAGARVVSQPERGYGNAYREGLAHARGRFIVMGDADGSYDFLQLDQLVRPLQEGYSYVLGDRFGGRILPGAMSWSHRYVGNPVLTAVLNRFFHLHSADAHSGMRAFTREAYEGMDLRCPGMEFASELAIKAGRTGLPATEVPITYHPRLGESKLQTWRDGWRHLRFMLLLCPTYLFFVPGALMFVVGVVGQAALLPGPLPLGFHTLDMHFSALFALLSILGYQTLLFGLFAKVYTRGRELEEPGRLLAWFDHRFSLERGLLVGGALFLAGFTIDAIVLVTWLSEHMGPTDAIRPALFAMTLMCTGAQTVFASFFLSLFRHDA